jgi:hypothetical protein
MWYSNCNNCEYYKDKYCHLIDCEISEPQDPNCHYKEN